jgi:hypothetical protein
VKIDRELLEQQGFSGFVRLCAVADSELPQEAGVYVVVRASDEEPEFLSESIGGHFKGHDPSVSLAKLERKWVSGAQVLYVGKADSRQKGSALRQRIKEFRNFGAGKPVGHWGGRYIWQLADSAELLIAWRVTKPEEAPQVAESKLIEEFWQQYNALPFANLRR